MTAPAEARRRANLVVRLGGWLMQTLAYPDIQGGYFPLTFTTWVTPGWQRSGAGEEA